MVHAFSEKRAQWDKAVKSNDVSIWRDYLHRLGGQCDLFSFVADRGELVDLNTGKVLTISRWLTHMMGADERLLQAEARSEDRPIEQRLPLINFLVWRENMRKLLANTRGSLNILSRGAFVYYCDLLHAAILCRFELSGEYWHLRDGLAIPRPHAFLDPVQAVKYAQNRGHVDVIKDSLAMPARIVVHRNTIVSVERTRHPGVFGPTIDTLYMTDWLFANRFIRDSAQNIKSALEVGCGNGLIASSFVRNAPNLSRLECVDVDFYAVGCTAQNVGAQAAVSSNLSTYLSVGEFDASRFSKPFDLVVSNPPYIPIPDGWRRPARGTVVATHGTELIASLIRSVPKLLTPSGELILVSSLLALTEIDALARENGLSMEKLVERQVPFDISGIDGGHIDWLIERGLHVTEQGDYMHDIGVIRVGKSGAS